MKLFIENIAQYPAARLEPDSTESIPGYTDKTNDIISWRDYGLDVCTDYLQVRDCIRLILNTSVWTTLTVEEKYATIDFYTREDGITIEDDNSRKILFLISEGYTQEEAKDYMQTAWAEFHKEEIKACYKRAYNKTIFKVFSKYLNLEEAADLTRVIQDLYYMYTTQGIKGTKDGHAGEGLYDFIESTPGTSYETAGLEQQGYTMQTGDPDTTNFVAELMDVLRGGNYES